MYSQGTGYFRAFLKTCSVNLAISACVNSSPFVFCAVKRSLSLYRRAAIQRCFPLLEGIGAHRGSLDSRKHIAPVKKKKENERKQWQIRTVKNEAHLIMNLNIKTHLRLDHSLSLKSHVPHHIWKIKLQKVLIRLWSRCTQKKKKNKKKNPAR